MMISLPCSSLRPYSPSTPPLSSARSLRGYRVLGPLIRRALGSVHRVAAQSEDDARRFHRTEGGVVLVTREMLDRL